MFKSIAAFLMLINLSLAYSQDCDKFIDHSGKEVTPLIYESVQNFNRKYTGIWGKANGKSFIINNPGKCIKTAKTLPPGTHRL